MVTSSRRLQGVAGSEDFQAQCNRAFELLGSDADAVLIVPPFADLYFPALGVHILQAAAERAGLRVRVLYANILFAALSGDKLYAAICHQKYPVLWGERIFAATAFGLPPLGHEVDKLRAQLAEADDADGEPTFESLAALEREAGPFCAALAKRFAGLRCRVVGASSTFQQAAAASALLAQIKRVRPDAITVIGGANCEGEMAHGIASLGAPIDYIFSGECESAFPDFLRRVANLALLRYARSVGLTITWNLLIEFPGDQREDYDTLALIPLIHHLSPAKGTFSINIERFSPYYNEPAAHGVSNIEPMRSYAWTFPRSADLRRLAYHFEGNFECAQTTHPELRELIDSVCSQWRDSWKAGSRPPVLSLSAGEDGFYTLLDTRGLEGTETLQFLDEEQARTVLIGGPLESQPLAAWAIERKLAVTLDGWCAPLATANLETWRRLDAKLAEMSEAAPTRRHTGDERLRLPLLE